MLKLEYDTRFLYFMFKLDYALNMESSCMCKFPSNIQLNRYA